MSKDSSKNDINRELEDLEILNRINDVYLKLMEFVTLEMGWGLHSRDFHSGLKRLIGAHTTT